MEHCKIKLVVVEDITLIVPLFDRYRMFYKQASDLAGARSFLEARLRNKESLLFIALKGEQAIGFTQVYFLFSSVSMEPMLLLNDLFIDEDYRSYGAGTALIDAVKNHCISSGQKGVLIQTAVDNPAQKLYERLGFTKDPDLHYFWSAT